MKNTLSRGNSKSKSSDVGMCLFRSGGRVAGAE